MMEVKLYKTGREFLIENEKILLERESANQLILFNAYKNQDNLTSHALFFGKISDLGKPALLFCNVLPFNLLMYNMQEDNTEYIKGLADYIVDNEILINGVNSSKNCCKIFMERYKERRKEKYFLEKDFIEHIAMDIMELTKLNTLELASGNCRLAKMEDKGVIARWIGEFVKEALEEELNYEQQLVRAENIIKEEHVYVYEDSKKTLVSMAAASRPLKRGICVNYVYTPKEYRGFGYAASNVYLMSKRLLEGGYQFCSLFVDKKNPISNHIYKKIGYKIIENQYDYKLIDRL